MSHAGLLINLRETPDPLEGIAASHSASDTVVLKTMSFTSARRAAAEGTAMERSELRNKAFMIPSIGARR
jgi:hypothetical protein